eukprot:3933864-Rhodomonas_salina.1
MVTFARFNRVGTRAAYHSPGLLAWRGGANRTFSRKKIVQGWRKGVGWPRWVLGNGGVRREKNSDAGSFPVSCFAMSVADTRRADTRFSTPFLQSSFSLRWRVTRTCFALLSESARSKSVSSAWCPTRKQHTRRSASVNPDHASRFSTALTLVSVTQKAKEVGQWIEHRNELAQQRAEEKRQEELKAKPAPAPSGNGEYPPGSFGNPLYSPGSLGNPKAA